MYKLIIRDKFEAAHQLHGHAGKCACLHGHTWRVEAVFNAENLDSIGMAEDFGVLKAILKAAIEEFDHTCLNDITYFKVANPTAENLSSLIYVKLKEKLSAEDIKTCGVAEVKVWESQDAGCAYSEE